ncbi:DUF7146 domain-containing protein [Bartonella sp. LJL80]
MADRTEEFCRQYLSNGKKNGNYWIVGDINNSPGQSMYVRLHATHNGAAGKWNDSATGEHGDLLDIIRESLGLVDMGDILREARDFLSLPAYNSQNPHIVPNTLAKEPTKRQSVEKLWSLSIPIRDTLAETYLQKRGIYLDNEPHYLRFHPKCYFKTANGTFHHLPAMIGALTDNCRQITGLHRTFLNSINAKKASISDPRKAMGDLVGSSIRFGTVNRIQLVGEGIETVLSLHVLLPQFTAHAACSSSHLPSIPLDPSLRRLYIAHDNDAAGDEATRRLIDRASEAGIETVVLLPKNNDFNDDLQAHGPEYLRARLAHMLHPNDRQYLDT